MPFTWIQRCTTRTPTPAAAPLLDDDIIIERKTQRMQKHSSICLALTVGIFIGAVVTKLGPNISDVSISSRLSSGMVGQESATPLKLIARGPILGVDPNAVKPALEGHAGFKRLTVLGRRVMVYVPQTRWHSRKAVIVLHGSEDSPEGIADSSRFHEIAARTYPGFLVAYPDMAVPGGDEWGYDAPWEIAFFKQLVDVCNNDFKRDHVYVVGHSSGGSMALYLQNNHGELFKAAAAVEAGVEKLERWDNASRGIPTMVIWNHNDPVLAQYGGDHLYQTTVGHLRRHHYPNDLHDISPLPSGFDGITDAERQVWTSTAASPPLVVVSWRSVVPTHQWVNNRNIPGVPLDASILIWDFFLSISNGGMSSKPASN